MIWSLKMKLKVIDGLGDAELALTRSRPNLKTVNNYLRNEKILHWLCLVQYNRLEQLLVEAVDLLHVKQKLFSHYYLYLVILDAKRRNTNSLIKKLKKKLRN